MSRARPGRIRRATRRLANPAMVGWSSFGITLVAWLLSMYPLLLRGETLMSWRNLAAWFVIVLAGQAVLFSILLLAKRLWLARSWSRRHPSVALWTIILAVAVGLGVSRTVAGEFFNERGWLLIGGEFFLYGVVVVAAAGYASVVLSEYRDSLRELSRTRASLDASIGSSREQLITDREHVLGQAHTVLDEALERLGSSPATAATFLSEASEQVVRPFSHRLVKQRPEVSAVVKRVPSPRWREVFSSLADKSLISPVALAVAVLFLSSRLTVTSFEPAGANVGPTGQGVSISVNWISLGQSLLQLLIVFSATLGVALLVNWISNRNLPRLNTAGKWALQWVGIVSVALVSQAIIVMLFMLAGFPPALVFTATTAALTTGLVIGVSILVGLVRAVGVALSDVLRQLQDVNSQLEWALGRLGQELWQQRRAMGVVLHGVVRSALVASAMLLRQSAKGPGDQVPGVAESEQVRKRLTEVRTQLGVEPPPVDPAETLGQLVELWRGTCDVSIEVDEDTMVRLASDPLAAESAMQVIDEACANAITHAKAHFIRVRATAEEDWVDIDVVNDGEALVASPRKGLGSNLLDEVATQWELSTVPEGTRFRARLPVQ